MKESSIEYLGLLLPLRASKQECMRLSGWAMRNLMGEVIEIHGDQSVIQVYEDTSE